GLLSGGVLGGLVCGGVLVHRGVLLPRGLFLSGFFCRDVLAVVLLRRSFFLLGLLRLHGLVRGALVPGVVIAAAQRDDRTAPGDQHEDEDDQTAAQGDEHALAALLLRRARNGLVRSGAIGGTGLLRGGAGLLRGGAGLLRGGALVSANILLG